MEVRKFVVSLWHGHQFRWPVNSITMNKEQIKANFKQAHGQAVQGVAQALYVTMEANAVLAHAREIQRNLEKQFRLDMASAGADNQIELPLGGASKK